MTTATELRFVEDTHQYYLGERELLSVTTVLKMAGVLDPRRYTDFARDRGRLVHQALEWFDVGDLDEDGLDDRLVPYLEAWKAFLRESGFVVASTERRLYSEPRGIAGTVDRVGTLKGRPTVIDLKTGGPERWHALQVAAYASMVREADGVPLAKIQRACVYLTHDGRYRLEMHDDKQDMAVFDAARVLVLWGLNLEQTERTAAA